MPLETIQFISDFVPTNPAGTDQESQGDDHIRGVKLGILNSFPNITGAMTATHTVLNGLDSRVSTLESQAILEDGSNPFAAPQSMGGNRLTNLAAPTQDADAATKEYVDDQIAAVSTQEQIFNQIYPVNSVYINTTNTDPASLLGFGAWTKISRGRVLMGEGTGDDGVNASESFAIGSSGGRYQHELSLSELPAHRHDVVGGQRNGALTGSNQVAVGHEFGNAFSYQLEGSSAEATLGSRLITSN